MKRVELHTFQKVKDGHEKDYCVRHGLIGACVWQGGGYSKLASKARRLSRQIGNEFADAHHYPATEKRVKGLAAVAIITYEQDDEKTEERWDFFEDGKYSYTIKEVWRKCGVYTKDLIKEEH